MDKIKPLQDKVLLKKVESSPSREEVVKGGIILPKEEKPIVYGEVIRVSSELESTSINEGDNVLFSEFGGKEISIEDETYILISYKDITAKVEVSQ